MKKLVLILTFLALPLSSYAQDAFYVSGILGMTQLDVDVAGAEYDAELSYGLRAGLLFNDHFSAGVFLHRVKAGLNNSPGTDTTIDHIMAEATYYFAEADENTFWVSGLLGTGSGKTTFTGGETTDDGTSYGAAAGYHFMVAPNFSVSPQITYIRTQTDDEVSELSGMVNLTLWL